jgi:branched-chain amino acid aminotransferase
MGFEESKWIWQNGRFVSWEDATMHVSAHGLHYGSGVFEGIRCYDTADGPAVFRLEPHLERFYCSAAAYGMEVPFSQSQLSDAILELIRLNDFTSCYVRPLCFYGSGSLSLHPGKCPIEVVILAWPWAPYLGAAGLEQGVRVTVSPWQKFHSQMMPTTAKACGQYVNSILAVREAVSRGFDEALLLNSSGDIAEGSGENLFIVKDRALLTNGELDSILMGITRDAVIKLASDLGYSVTTRSLKLSDLATADEAFFTGTAAEVTPIREIDGAEINGGVPGPVTREIQRAFFSAVGGNDERYSDWLQHVACQTTRA